MDTLTRLMREKRKAEKRVTAENRESMIINLNKNMKEFGYSDFKISKSATAKEVNRYKKEYLERITYDIVNLAVQQGKSVIAEVEARDLKKSSDTDSQKLGMYAKDLAKAKHESDRKLTKENVQFLERGNVNIKGYGNTDIISLFEKTKTKADVQALIDEVKSQDPKQIYYDKELSLFDTVFQKVGITREKDLDKIKDKLRGMDLKEVLSHTNYLLETLDLYDSDKQVGPWKGNETELKNARIDDMLVRLGINKTGKTKLSKTFKKVTTKPKE